jgi:hypothetical protein
MTTLNQVLEMALQLPYEQQEMLIQILRNRHHESRRAEVATDVRQTLAEFPRRQISTPISRRCDCRLTSVFSKDITSSLQAGIDATL